MGPQTYPRDAKLRNFPQLTHQPHYAMISFQATGRSTPRFAFLFLLCAALLAGGAHAQQQGDPNFNPTVQEPAFPEGDGPVVLVDEAHNNFHTAEGRYRPFAQLLRRDGYRVQALSSPITKTTIETADVLVISNALADSNVDDWRLPTPSAFSNREIATLQTWVRQGGALLLIADHMPFPGAAREMAARFGVLMGNGYAMAADSSGMMQFRRVDGSLQQHPITEGRDASETVDSVTSFAGQAFRLRPNVTADSLMILGQNTTLLLPTEAGQFSRQTPQLGAAGMLQGATLRVGSGRVAVFGEAAMFTAQLSGSERRPMGMNHPRASQNVQFVLNVLHWLTGVLPEN